MIVSHKYRFIFIKTVKTAGTSIEIALSKYLGRNDIITPISPEDETIRMELGHRGPQNFLKPLHKNSLRDWARLVKNGEREAYFVNHMGARDIRERVGLRVWNDYYKFCFARNPWDRIVSLYYWEYRDEPRPNFSQFVLSNQIEAIKRRGSDLYTIDGDIVVDRVCRYEHLVEDLEEVRKRVGIPDPLSLPTAKSRFRRNKKLETLSFDKDENDAVAAVAKMEIELLGYHPPNQTA